MSINMDSKEWKKVAVGLAFLLPNILGFLAFVAGPLIISLVMSFTNWNLEMHNVFKTEPVKFVGLGNYVKLFSEPDFLRYLGNTLFFMIGIPFGVGGSLVAALLLNCKLKSSNKKIYATIIITILLTVSMGMLTLSGFGASAMTLLICGLAGMVLIGGNIGGQTVYRTLFYFPHFTAGVATFILWKKLYSPDTGPINNALRPLLDNLSPVFAQTPLSVTHTLSIVLIFSVLLLFAHRIFKNINLWKYGEFGSFSLLASLVLLAAPLIMEIYLTQFNWIKAVYSILFTLVTIRVLYCMAKGRQHPCPFDRGLSDALVLGGLLTVGCFILIGLASVVYDLPVQAVDGLEPPKWIADYYWAKPSLMIMGLWGAIGSNNMLLYLAGLSGVPQDLYEAADIDGASSFQRFWHITWPQLSNITFFILVMSVIGGLQGGFEMARTMTQGGPAGATTTLSYYIYSEGFATGRLGYASAVAWVLFALIFSVTAFNWKFGNRYTSE